ncbi:type VII secretion protein EccB [Streptomyces sp. Je 1-79]|uniref:type VII secretion protein EccB n=1 Tax=Streptomyces sp. Je 1-79 TaxID=2943847 RepID=UPI0021A4AFAE|nr:type VII secretion protein EccB [Streptomyces sp. Je 1-79]MCT4354067.1 type VII secretion protein EccB [Streptomyces sp. Je 1-79]
MASRRDELNAYTFAKRRLIAQFVQPNATGSEEGAPRPLRAVAPGAIVGVVILAVFGAWGMFKPVAPKDWDKPGENVIIASKSTTRYVVLKTGDKTQLHPVLNMSSAKLLLDPNKGKVINVDESVLDSGKIPHGATLGIPYAPDRLPTDKEAGAPKRWAVCERPGEGGRAIQKAAFVLAEREEKKTDGADRLSGGELLYVEGPNGTRYVIDAKGTAYQVEKDELLLRQLVGQGRTAQRVSDAWMRTLHKGDPIAFPTVPGRAGDPAGVDGLAPEVNKIGMVLSATDGTRKQMYVVLQGTVAPVSDFMAKLLLNSKQLVATGQAGQATSVSGGAFQPGRAFGNDKKWPQAAPVPVNEASTTEGSRNTVCNVLREVDGDNGATTLSTWAGTDFPATLPTGSSSAYVTPGSGQLFRQFKGSTTGNGFLFLVTDTGLRYAMQSNGDSATDDAGIGSSGSEKEKQERLAEQQQAQNRLGYKNVEPLPIPAEWSTFLPTGPRLSTGAARQPQGS